MALALRRLRLPLLMVVVAATMPPVTDTQGTVSLPQIIALMNVTINNIPATRLNISNVDITLLMQNLAALAMSDPRFQGVTLDSVLQTLFTADVTVVWHRATSDGFNEPREPACAELDGVTQIDGPRIAASALSEWAAAWVAGHQDRIADEITEF